MAEITYPSYPVQLTIRMQIVQEIAARLARISKANGFQTDIGINLWYGMQPTPEPHIYPILYYWDHFESLQALSGTQLKTFQLQIESFEKLDVAPEDATKITEAVPIAQQQALIANQHLADLTVALTHSAKTGLYEVRFNGLAHGIVFQESDPFQGIQPSPLLTCGLNSQWTITYQHANGDPYNLVRKT